METKASYVACNVTPVGDIRDTWKLSEWTRLNPLLLITPTNIFIPPLRLLSLTKEIVRSPSLLLNNGMYSLTNSSALPPENIAVKNIRNILFIFFTQNHCSHLQYSPATVI